MKNINVEAWKVIVGILVTVLLSTAGFVVNKINSDIQEVKEDKVNNDVLIQYMKLIEERNQLQMEINKENKTDHSEIIKELKLLNEKIHKLDVKVIGYIRTRGNSFERWDLEDVTLFMLEAHVFDKPKKVGLI